MPTKAPLNKQTKKSLLAGGSVPGAVAMSSNVSFREKTAVVMFGDNQTNVAALVDATSNMGFPSKELKP